jgi:hypothetical protein
MRADYLILLKECCEPLPSPPWANEWRTRGRCIVIRFGSPETATVFALTWGSEAGLVLHERLGDWDEARRLCELEAADH